TRDRRSPSLPTRARDTADKDLHRADARRATSRASAVPRSSRARAQRLLSCRESAGRRYATRAPRPRGGPWSAPARGFMGRLRRSRTHVRATSRCVGHPHVEIAVAALHVRERESRVTAPDVGVGLRRAAAAEVHVVVARERGELVERRAIGGEALVEQRAVAGGELSPRSV